MDIAYKEEMMLKLDAKVKRMITLIGDKSPHVAGADGKYDDNAHDWWTSGFWPGLLWVMYDYTGDEVYKAAAWDWDHKLNLCFEDYPVELHHDVGFQFLPTAVCKYEWTGDQEALRIGLKAANFLMGRYNAAGEFIRAWNVEDGVDYRGWAIIDCLMNIPLLTWATKTTGDPRYQHVAMKHTDTFLKYGIRDDGSSCHVLSFNPQTGEFIEQIGGQGYSPTSAWSRGNAWALYGLSLAYRHFGDHKYLTAAKRVAHHFITALPDDSIPYWDFRLPTLEGEPRDSSAAAIAASGLMELAEHLDEHEKRIYLSAAERMLYALSEHYATWDQPGHEAILIGGTGHKPANSNINVSLIYGDYYFVEAFAKLNGWKNRIFSF